MVSYTREVFLAIPLIYCYFCKLIKKPGTMPPRKTNTATVKPGGASRSREISPTKQQIESRAEDTVLIRNALAGKQEAFRAIMDKYHDNIAALLHRMIRNNDEVEDLTQEAFIKAFASLANYSNEFAFSTWLYKIATNNCIDHIRKRKLPTFSIDKPIESKDGDYSFEIPDSSYEPDRSLINRQRTLMLEEAIASLPLKYRTVILMRHTDEMDYQDIADELHVPIGTVKAHIFRAREMLNNALRKKIQNY